MSLSLFNTSVQEAWIDYNGHMNAGYYNVVIDQAAEQLIKDMGGIEYMARTSGTFYSVETHIIYASELKLGDPIRVETQIVSHDRKRVHLFSTLYHGEKGYKAASGETMMLHYVQNENAVRPMPDDFYTAVEALAQQHANAPIPHAVGRAVRAVKKK
ncbi:MAG: thioesterase family protein [Candidatus Promineifilaceae bacterium]